MYKHMPDAAAKFQIWQQVRMTVLVLTGQVLYCCAEGVVLLCIVLRGLLKRHMLWSERVIPWSSKGKAPVRRPIGFLLQWLLMYYPVPVGQHICCMHQQAWCKSNQTYASCSHPADISSHEMFHCKHGILQHYLCVPNRICSKHDNANRTCCR